MNNFGMMEDVYDICVVGAGMVGSAAAKWLCKSKDQGRKVCLIGPQEPTEEEWKSTKRQIFGCHYDEGRLTRDVDESYVWALLSQRSIARYREIEQESGIRFYEEVGGLLIDLEGGECLRETIENANKMGVDSYEVLGSKELQNKFPFLWGQGNCQFLWNYKNAGHISPRKLVAAQQKIASLHGCHIIHEVAVQVKEVALESGAEVVRVTLEGGRVVNARRVLLCTGASINYHSLLPDNNKIDVRLFKVFVVKPELSEEDARKMSTMPIIMSRLAGKSYYLLPPIKYTDGKYYLKIGPLLALSDYTDAEKTRDMGMEETAEWFRSEGGGFGWKDEGMNILKELIPDLKPVSIVTSSCVVALTATSLLYCDMLTPRLGACVGMTGRGAKCSDEIGRMCARMIAKGSWDYDLPADSFKMQYK